MTITQYEEAHLPGILALCEAENWPSLPAAPLTGARRIDLVTEYC